MTAIETPVEDAIFYLPRATIHPDPDQPRLSPDAELQASIDSEGIIQPITVRPHPELENEWMLVDGERRWRGGDHLKTIPCRIRLDLEEPVDRLITQLSANNSKPLSPVEQARAFKKILDDDPKLSQANLAKRLGIPRSTIGDRIRLIEIHPAWMKLIDSGRLQVSHAPLIHQYRAVPEEYQVKAAGKVSAGDGWQIQKYEKADIIPIAAFRDILRDAFKDYVIRLDEVRSYKGPVLEIEEEKWSYGPGAKQLRKVKYAADPAIWRPIKREAEKRAKKARVSSPSHSGQGYESPMTKTLKTLKAAGIEVPFRKSNGHLDTTKLKDGEVEIFTSNGWAAGIHPQTLLDHLDASTVTRVQGSYGEGKLVTTDAAAVAAAREAHRDKVAEVSKKVLAPVKEKLSDKVLAAYAVTGPGVKGLFGYLDLQHGDEKTVAFAIGVPVDGGDVSQADAEKLLAALAVCATQEIKLPNRWTIEDRIRQAMGSPAFKIRPTPQKVQEERVAAFQADVAKSKKQQKREARAAGKQVGDPKRAKKIDAILAEAAEPKCIHCGCTEDQACEGGCAWSTTDPHVCTACAEAVEDAGQRHEIDDGAEDLEEATV